MKKALYTLLALFLLAACADRPENPQVVAEQPHIYPDYIGVTVPVGIAPLNFNMRDDCERMDVTVRGQAGGEINANGDFADFDIADWHDLLEQNRGKDLTVTVCAKNDGQWKQYKDFTIHVSPYALDEWGVTYRRIAPGYEVFSHMGIYQRDLATFDEYEIIDNGRIPGQCVNCHMSNQTDPERFVFHVRGNHGATMIQQQGKREWLQAKNELLGGSMVYPYWHPSGKYCAFSTNQTQQSFHAMAGKRIEVFDMSSDVFVYQPDTHEMITDSLLSTPDWSENSPVFSPDGKTLYYMTCRQQEYPAHYQDEQYNLCKISFDPATGTYGHQVDTLFNAVKMGKSLTWPRPSYDGKYILFTLTDYGYFSIWHKEANQWLLNLQTGEARPLDEINSPDAESYHNWNVNSHWIVFTSRRENGLYTQLYLASVDDNGHFSKPFLLPQQNPRDYYGKTVYSFNTPDFTKTKVDFSSSSAASEILNDERVKTNVR